MKGFEKIRIIRNYCDYVEEHLINIQASWKVMQEKCKSEAFIYDDFRFNIIDVMIHHHDISKFSPEEFIQYAEYFYNNGNGQKDFENAWEHHKACNPHHWEHWTKKRYSNPYEPECHMVCMVIDWMAMGIKFGDTAEEYYAKNKDKIYLPPWARNAITEIFAKLKDEEK